MRFEKKCVPAPMEQTRAKAPEFEVLQKLFPKERFRENFLKLVIANYSRAATLINRIVCTCFVK